MVIKGRIYECVIRTSTRLLFGFARGLLLVLLLCGRERTGLDPPFSPSTDPRAASCDADVDMSAAGTH